MYRMKWWKRQQATDPPPLQLRGLQPLLLLLLTWPSCLSQDLFSLLLNPSHFSAPLVALDQRLYLPSRVRVR